MPTGALNTLCRHYLESLIVSSCRLNFVEYVAIGDGDRATTLDHRAATSSATLPPRRNTDRVSEIRTLLRDRLIALQCKLHSCSLSNSGSSSSSRTRRQTRVRRRYKHGMPFWHRCNAAARLGCCCCRSRQVYKTPCCGLYTRNGVTYVDGRRNGSRSVGRLQVPRLSGYSI